MPEQVANLFVETSEGRRRSGELRRTIALGVVSEVLLVAGIILMFLESTQVSVACDYTSCLLIKFEWQVFYIALVLMVASAIGFLLTLWLSWNALIHPQGDNTDD